MPTEFTYDADAAQDLIDESNRYIDELEKKIESERIEEEAKKAEEEQAAAEKEDPRNKEGWGFKAVAEEVKSAAAGGIQDTASSITTFPERAMDMVSGEMQEQIEEEGEYRPDFDPFVNYEDPIETRTWWGKLMRGTVHFGTMAAAIVPTAKYTAARVGIQGTIAGLSNPFIRSAAIGAVSDLISKDSDGHNALGSMRDQYGWMDTPLSTKDGEHPLIWKLKNITEGMGIGNIFDRVALILGKGGKGAVKIIKDRNKSVELQTLRKGLQELRSNEKEFRASKNKPIADPHQGAHISEQDPFTVWETQKRIRKEWGAEDGSTGSVTTPVQRERGAYMAGTSEEIVEDVLKKLYSVDKFKRIMNQVKNSRRRLVEVFGDSVEMHQRITQGRNAADMDAHEYLEEIFATSDVFDKGTAEEITTITSRNVVATDLIVGTLLRQVRDIGIAGREIADFADLGDIDGPAQQIIETMLTALQEVKKARIVKSRNFAELGAGKRRYLQETLDTEMADTREAIMTILKIAKDSPDENLMNALFETFSSMKTVHSLDDFDAWARKMLRGGDIEGKRQTGALVRELGGVMIHSILSGPKTAARAIMGTSTATFLRPMQTTLGAAFRLPFTGDTRTLRAGLASLNAMMEAIPESFELFKTKLNSYWSGDISTVKSRFSEYTQDDNNWEILRRWVEDSGRASDGDRIVFNLANMARNWNNNNWLTYSTKIMAATDDTFKYIIGRAKMREKALNSAFDAQSKGKLTAYQEITPELIRMYEDDFYREIFDANGDLIDEAAKYASKEVTLTKDLTGMAEGLNQVFQANPWAKPFFLFARTGVNGLELTAKHTPGFNFLVKEFNDIAAATADDLSDVLKYGITSAEELANAKALQSGRLVMGTSLVALASWKWLNGEMTGNGPVDRQKRQVWIDAGYKPRSLKAGPVWISYDSLEPFNLIMSTISDIGDASQLMGEEWTEKSLLKVSLVVAQGVTSKSYLAGMQQFVDLFGGRAGQAERIVASISNNTIPLAGLRNELGKVFTPYMRELGSGVDQAWRNRNLLTEQITTDPLPIKYNILNGDPVKDWDPMTRMWNAVMPVNFSLDTTPGSKLLFKSGYDLRTSTYSSPTGYDLSDSPVIRSMFQKAIGNQNLERQLDKLADDPKMLESIDIMENDIRAGNRGDYEAMDYFHNRKIDDLVQKARKLAWAEIISDPKVEELMEEQDEAKLKRIRKTQDTINIDPILSIYK